MSLAMNLESIPCAYKERVESRAVDELCMISEQCWTSQGKNTKRKVVSQESREDLGSLLYKMLVIEDDNTSFSTFKTPLTAWKVCLSPKQHKGGYQLDPQSFDALGANKATVLQKNPQFFTPPGCYNNFQEDKTQLNSHTCVERDREAKDVKHKGYSFAAEQSTINNNNNNNNNNNDNIQDGERLDRNTDSPMTEFQFCHSIYPDERNKKNREQIPNVNLQRHVTLRENSSNTVKITPRKSHVVKSKTIPRPSFTFAFHKFCISNREESTSDSGVLKVGPCPRFTNLPEQNYSKKSRYGKIPNLASTSEKKMDQRKETKFQSTRPEARKENVTISGPGSERKYNGAASKTESNEGKLKKVELKVLCSSESPRVVPKTGRGNNKSMTRTLGAYLKPWTQCKRSYSEIPCERKVIRKPTFEEREFLRITTPKPIIHCQQLGKTPSDFGESPGFSPYKSVEVSPTRSPVSSVSGTSVRSQAIAEILMKREPQLVFPKNSSFQACITPSNYSSSSVESHNRHIKDGTPDGLAQDLDEEKNYNENHKKRMPSKPSIPRIGPFISG